MYDIDKIVVGSFEGILRILLPHDRKFTLADNLLEANLGKPILQIAFGRFNQECLPNKSLAVLHPHSLAVFQITSKNDLLFLNDAFM